MKVWPVQDAKARFSELLETCMSQGPQMVTKRGEDAAVLVSVAEWRRLQQAAPPALPAKAGLRAEPRRRLPLLPRGRLRHRPPPEFD